MLQVKGTRREFMMGVAGTAFLSPQETARWAEVNAFLNAEKSRGLIPGAALIAAQDRKVVFERYVGNYDSVKERQMELHGEVRHVFYSYSKLISATVVAMFHQEGLLDYDAPVSTYIPEFRGGGKDKITLRHLLSHSAGIPNVPLGGVGTEADWRTAIKTVCDARTEWEPGSRTAYHALSAMLVAAEAVRRVAHGKPWAQICKERLFDPIGAKTLSFELPTEGTPFALTPHPAQKPESLRQAFASVVGHPAGGCCGTPGDAIKVLQLHTGWGTWGKNRLLYKKSLIEMHSIQYEREIERAVQSGKAPTHEPWGLGILLRGKGNKTGGHDWFGMGEQSSPTVFGHAGIDTVIGVADIMNGNVLFFASTDSPNPQGQTVYLRNGVTNRVFAVLKSL